MKSFESKRRKLLKVTAATGGALAAGRCESAILDACLRRRVRGSCGRFGSRGNACATDRRRLRGGPHRQPEDPRSQCIGGMIGGIGMALMEHSVVDPRNGRVPNANLAEYAVPVHADAPPVMDLIFVEEHDPHVNPLGVKGVGETAIVGVAPAITNAIFHATGKRIRTLPVTPDRLL